MKWGELLCSLKVLQSRISVRFRFRVGVGIRFRVRVRVRVGFRCRDRIV